MSRTDRTPRRRLDPATRQTEILQVAAQAFASQPYEQISMATVAEQARASEALLYRYFGSKPGLYTEVLRAAAEQIAADQQTAIAQLGNAASPRERLTAMVDSYLDYLGTATPEWAITIITASNDPAEARVARDEIHDERLSALRAVNGLPAVSDYLLHGFLGFMDAAVLAWINRGCPSSNRAQLTQIIVDVLLAPTETRRPDRRGKFAHR